MASLNVGNLGDFLREQRRSAQLSLRQLADAAGVSNPYLRQIERGLRKPSAEILQQLAKALRISAETLYVQAGLLDGAPEGAAGGVDEYAATSGGEGGESSDGAAGGGVRAAIAADPWLSERQKRALLDIYEVFRN